jgi:hypothetical protein
MRVSLFFIVPQIGDDNRMTRTGHPPQPRVYLQSSSRREQAGGYT